MHVLKSMFSFHCSLHTDARDWRQMWTDRGLYIHYFVTGHS